MRKKVVAAACTAATVLTVTGVAQAQELNAIPDAVRTLDGSGNNVKNPTWGRTNTQYLRVAPANYADGIKKPVSGPPTRYVSNRIHNDSNQNLFSENGVTQWGFVWGQFLDHTFGLRQEVGGENAPIAFTATDPLESFTNTLGAEPRWGSCAPPPRREPASATPCASRSTPSAATSTRSAVYGGTDARLEWLREGPVDGNLSNNGAKLLLAPDGTLPRRTARGNAATAPRWTSMGRPVAPPAQAMVAGDVRANENIALTATHTLFAREHNRIVERAATDARRGGQVPDRAAAWSGPSSSTSPTTSSCPASG